MARLNLRREDLVLQVAMRDTGALDQPNDVRSLGDGARQRLLAGNAAQSPLAGLERVDDLLDVLDPRMIRAGQPEGVDRRIRDEIADRREAFCGSDIQTPRQRGGAAGVLLVRTPYAAHVGIAHPAECLHVKARVEPAADESNPKTLWRLFVLFVTHIRSSLTRGYV
jgi:hypothetical protein